jgi:TusA-related sulfurtransferase
MSMQELDVRGLPPPEPFEKVVSALKSLPPEGALRVYIHREPFPLYEILRDTGYTWQTVGVADGDFEILITRAT